MTNWPAVVGWTLVLMADHVWAQARATAPLSGEAFWRAMGSSASVTWSGLPLRDALTRITSQWQIAIFLDRRVDPDQHIEFACRDTSLEELLRRLATTLNVSVSVVDCVVYIAPPGVAPRVATLAEVQFDTAQRNRWQTLTRRRDIQWPFLTEPRFILSDVVTSTGYNCANLADVPHDLWPANHLPALPTSHLLTLLLAGFDLSYELDASERCLRLVPMPQHVKLVREYTVSAKMAQQAAAWQQQFPDAKFHWQGNRLRLEGTADDHQAIRRKLTGAGATAAPRTSAVHVRYSLRAENRFEPLARALAERLELQLELDPQVAEVGNRVVTIDVRNVTREQLLDALVNSVGWQYELSGNRLRLFPRAKQSPNGK